MDPQLFRGRIQIIELSEMWIFRNLFNLLNDINIIFTSGPTHEEGMLLNFL